MKRFAVALAVAVIYLLGSSEVSFAQHKDHDAKEKQTTKAPSIYTCPMHPEVVSDKPGKCPKCGMNLVSSDDPTMKITKARTLLNDAKRELARKGKYDCCMEDACDECALAHESCPCRSNVKAGKEVCTQCYGGWQRGEGKVSGVDPKDVKLGHGHKH